MGKSFVIIEPYSRVIMPDGVTYDAGDTVILSDANYALLNASQLRTFSGSSNVADPSTSLGPASRVTYTPAAGMSATNVQAALNELAARVAILEP